MNFINTVLGVPLGYVMWGCYTLVKNYGVAIILFTLLSKIILFPVSILVQKNSIKMVKLQPALDEIKRRFAGDKDKIAEEQIDLYDKEKYSPAMGCLPMLLQIPLILGLINVIYNPLQHLLRFNSDVINLFTGKATELLGVEHLGAAPQLKLLQLLHDPNMLPKFEALRPSVPDYDAVLSSMLGLNLNFFGIDLSLTPSITVLNTLLLIPILAGLSSFLLTFVQNKINVLQVEQSALSQWGMAAFLTLFSLYFAFIVPAGVGMYWIFSNLFAILQSLLLNKMYDPKKYIDYSLRPIKKKLTAEEKDKQKQEKKWIKQKEREDKKRFYADDNQNKQLVFYSEKSGFYKYFQNVIEYILDNSDIVIHYVTGDPYDAVFKMNNNRIVPYYIGDTALVSFMMKMDADMVVMTMPDIQQYQIKRSLVRKDTEYVYMFHAPASMHLTLRKGSLDNYDSVMCVGPHNVAEIRESEKLYKTKEKTLVECGYGVIENLSASYEKMEKHSGSKPQILIAPSWQPDNLLESCLDGVMDGVLDRGWKVILRPHPEFIKRFDDKMAMIMQNYGSRQNDDFIIETDFSSNDTIYQSDILITDWSNIAYEYSYSTKKPSIFIDTPMKIANPEYKKIPLEPLEISLRRELGVSIKPEELEKLPGTVQDMLDNPDHYRDNIQHAIDNYLYNFGSSGKAGGEYIIKQLDSKKKLKEELGDEFGL